jgi:hypothetical protein
MPKINYKTLLVIATSKNFSELAYKTQNTLDEGQTDREFDIGDNGKAADNMLSDVHADALLLDLLFKFNDRQKIILLYQILREAGYNLNHGDCAKTLSLTREHYMFLLKEVRGKAKKVLQEAGI